MSKPRVIKDYEKIDNVLLSKIKLFYPRGFGKYLVTFKNKKNKFVSALPFETEDRHFLIKMTASEAQEIVEEDDDYDDDGHLKADSLDGLQEDVDMGDVAAEAAKDED